MQRLIVILILLTLFIQACKNSTKTGGLIVQDTARKRKIDTTFAQQYAYEIEQYCRTRKGLLCNWLALYDIEKDTQTFELRLWRFQSLFEPSTLYLLKVHDSTWTLFQYQYFTEVSRFRNDDRKNSPGIDSVTMKNLKPRTTNWTTYIKSLQLDSLWSLKTESAIKDKSFMAGDGYCYMLEVNDRGRYKYVVYSTPELFQDDIYHERILEFAGQLTNAK